MPHTGLRRVICFAALLLAAPAAAEDPPQRPTVIEPVFGDQASRKPVAFTGDVFYWDRNTNVISGFGSIRLEQGARTLQADQIRLFIDKQIAELEGNVAVSQEGATVYGDAATYNLAEQRGTFERPRSQHGPWHVHADDIVREGPTTYRARRARVTTCDLEHPHWSIHVGDIEIDEEEQRVTGQNVVGRVGPVPIFYAPVYRHRLDRRYPPIEYKVGYQSDVGGFARFGFPLDVMDTIELQPRVEGYTASGPAVGLEAGGELFERTRFDTDAWYINDLNEDNTEDEGITPGRYKFDWYSRTQLPDDWEAMAQMEWLSDSRVLETFFWDDYREREEPETFLDFTRTKPHTVVEVLTEKRIDDFTKATETLPLVRADLLPYRLWDTPLFVSARADGAYAERKPSDTHLTYSRYNARLTAPYRVQELFTVTPFVDVDGRWHDAGNVGTGDEDYRDWVRPGATFQTRLHAPFPSPLARYTRMRHLFIPTLTYAWRDTDERPDPEDRLFFEPGDIFRNENSIELELRNKIQGRRKDGSIDDLIDYQATLDFAFDGGRNHLDKLENELIVRPANRWTFRVKSLHDYRNDRDAHNVNSSIQYRDRLGFSGEVGTVYADSRVGSWRVRAYYGGAIPLGETWRVGFKHRWDYVERNLDQQSFWIWHRFHCWEATFLVRDRERATTFMVLIGLTAFPDPQMDRYRHPSLVAEEPVQEDPLSGPDQRLRDLDLTPREEPAQVLEK